MIYEKQALGTFVEQYDHRVKDSTQHFSIDRIVGISSITKSFVPTKANLVDVTVDSYKIVPQGYFAFNPNTARMGDKVCIGLNQTNEALLVSSIYPVFRVSDNRLDPNYLMLLFKQPEFDRWARYVSHGSAREVLDWERLCELHIPVPPINEQRTAVQCYKTIENRIEILQKMNATLEKIGQLILAKALFSANSMQKPLGELVEFIDGDRGKNYPSFEDFSSNGFCLFLSAVNVTATGFDFTNCDFITEEKDRAMRNGHLSRFDVVLTSRGTLGNVALYDQYIPYENIRINSGMLILRPKPNGITPHVLFAMLKSSLMKIAIDQFKSGSAQPQLPIKDLQKIQFPVPIQPNDIRTLDSHITTIQNAISTNKIEMIYLGSFQRTLLQSITRKS